MTKKSRNLKQKLVSTYIILRLEVLIRSELLPFFMLSPSIIILYTEVSRLQILNVSTILCGTCIDGFAR